MKKWNPICIVLILLIGMIFISGCSSTAPVTTPTPQIVSIVSQAQEPIVDNWNITYDGTTLVYSFFSDGRMILSDNRYSEDINANWTKIKEDEYSVLTEDGVFLYYFVYNPQTDTLSDQAYPEDILYRQGKQYQI